MVNMKPLILIAEDNSVNRSILVKILSDEYSLLQADDGIKTLRAIHKYRDRLTAVILDLRMPGMSGEEILQELSKDQCSQDLPILVATGEQDSLVEHRCLELGAWDFVTKPYNVEIIRLRLHNIIGRRESNLLNRIRYISQRDKLTGIYNRDYFLEQTQMMRQYNPEVLFALIRMDIDRFRLFNASFGKKAGDDLLKRFAAAIREELQGVEHCTYGRIESDVFCICAPYDRERLLRRIQEVSEQAHGFFEKYRLELSFGIYIMDKAEVDIETAYSYTSEAGKKCKEDVRLTYVFYDDTMHHRQIRERQILNEMETAIQERQFHVYLQPKYSLAENAPCGAEALVRWAHPEHGLIPPGNFIPVFEENGFIDRLDYYMWENVCQLLSKWLKSGRRVDPVSVNVSRISMYNPNVVQDLIALADRYQVPHELLQLEITESAYMSNPELMKYVIGCLRNSGFTMLMDDFGSGYSSLNTLKDIDMDILKIDMKFLPSGDRHVKCEKILASVTRMADWLGMPVIVEGVETQEQLDFLISIGCGYVQGYYFAKPMPVEEYEKFLESRCGGMHRQEVDALSRADGVDMIWSVDEKTSELLRKVSVPFAVMEYSSTGVMALRMNDAYHRVFGGQKDHLALLDMDERNKLYAAIEDAVSDQKEGICDCMYLLSNGRCRWFRIHLQMISRVSNTILFGTTFMDITTEREQERELLHVLTVLKKPEQRDAQMMIVDDSEMSIEILKEMFESEYKVLTASNGQEAMELLKEHSDELSIILLDMMMPVMSGQEFLAQKNQMPEAAGIPVVVISSDNSEDMQINMLQSGVNDYVTKPFVPQTVQRRVRNVLEYSSRFRNLVHEYKQALLIKNTQREPLKKEGYTVNEIDEILDFMKHVFDVVRVVDPETMKVLEFKEDGTVVTNSYSCYQVWGREKRCENCTSQCALKQNCMLSKFELIEDDVFYVISQSIRVYLSETESIECVLEVVSHISEHIREPESRVQSVEEALEKTRRKIYLDPLTEAYNRRYYDEMKFLGNGLIHGPVKLGMILMDMHQFKQSNDLYGHAEGDRILMEVSGELRRQVREQDAVIRYGGDEFLILLNGCEKEQMQAAVERLWAAVSRVRYGPDNEICAEADFGYVHTDAFDGNLLTLQEMFKQADQQMYKNKHKRLL
ncbi:MAG: EAL domain-containing protein [Lachnospiraceae bacterium]|nr:EAL domain-containing protein [Lachnospiraceae bacterium]